jgi:hypothetical protein
VDEALPVKSRSDTQVDEVLPGIDTIIDEGCGRCFFTALLSHKLSMSASSIEFIAYDAISHEFIPSTPVVVANTGETKGADGAENSRALVKRLYQIMSQDGEDGDDDHNGNFDRHHSYLPVTHMTRSEDQTTKLSSASKNPRLLMMLWPRGEESTFSSDTLGCFTGQYLLCAGDFPYPGRGHRDIDAMPRVTGNRRFHQMLLDRWQLVEEWPLWSFKTESILSFWIRK